MRSKISEYVSLIKQLDVRALIAIISVELLLAPTVAPAASVPPQPDLPPAVFDPLREAILLSYDELFEAAPTLEFSRGQIDSMRKYLKDSRKYCVKLWNDRAKREDEDLRAAQDELKRRTAGLDAEQRRQLHCRIQNARLQKKDAEMLAGHAVPVAYSNRLAKLDVIEKWPDEYREIQRRLETGEFHNRRWSDVEDIGFREVGRDQEKDVKTGRDAVDELKRTGLMPPEIENEAVRQYVRDLASKIARHSDLQVPINVTVLNSKEINAFALPGGFLSLQRGLLEAAEDEAQLAGVIAHEIAHVTARHGRRLMKRATVSSIIYQAAQVAALVLTGGVASIGMYYALQYGFYGLGMVLSLDLLGVSRDFELEADQLGVQYAWKAGYDPTGFIRFFDKMATREGYVRGLSWFRTHPPFYERMVESKREILFLPEKENLIRQTAAFGQMKEELKKVTAEAEEEEEDRPSLLAPDESCPAPEKIEYEPGEGRIETICSLPVS